MQTDQENLFPEFGVNLLPEEEQVCNNIGDQFDAFSGNLDSNGLGPFVGSSQLDMGTHIQLGQACYPVMEINSSSSVEIVKEEFEEECSRKR